MDAVFSKVWEVGGAAGVSLAILWVIVKGLRKQQDKNTDRLESLTTDVAVIKTQVLSALGVAQDVKEHDRTLVEHNSRIKQNSKDINAQHSKIRDIDNKHDLLSQKVYSKH